MNPFFVYMLRCSDDSFYVGQTDDLERRLGEHSSGAFRGYTSKRLPVKLVWSCMTQDRNEARELEAKIKGWSRAKKLALILEDWNSIQALAVRRT